MAKTAKRRGRPPGSKNKKRGRPPGVQISKTARVKNGAPQKMEISQLRAYIGGLENLLAEKVTQQRKILESHLAELSGYTAAKVVGAVRAVMQVPRTGKRAKARPKYQSKKRPGVKWSGRGVLPIWMREEMKGTKLTKDDFLIKA